MVWATARARRQWCSLGFLVEAPDFSPAKPWAMTAALAAATGAKARSVMVVSARLKPCPSTAQIFKLTHCRLGGGVDVAGFQHAGSCVPEGCRNQNRREPLGARALQGRQRHLTEHHACASCALAGGHGAIFHGPGNCGRGGGSP